MPTRARDPLTKPQKDSSQPAESQPGSQYKGELQYKGKGSEMYITYDIEKRMRGGVIVLPKVQRVHIPGNVHDCKIGQVRKRTGRRVTGVRIAYEQRRRPYSRKGYTAERGKTAYWVPATSVNSTIQRFAKVIELPRRARNIQFYENARSLPEEYYQILQGNG